MTLILVAVALAAPSQAQIKFGAKAGLNLSEVSLSGNSNALSNKTGFFIGPTVKLTVPIVGLSFDASALYDQREAKIKGADETIRQQSFQVPINVRYGVGLGSIVNVFAFAGPQFGFNIGDKSETFKDAYNDAGKWTLRSSNLSANFGVGATVLKHLQVTVNYNVALGKTGEVTVAGVGQDAFKGKLKSNSWQIAAAYYF